MTLFQRLEERPMKHGIAKCDTINRKIGFEVERKQIGMPAIVAFRPVPAVEVNSKKLKT